MIIFDLDGTLADKDESIEPLISLIYNLWVREGEDIEIWSTRCESFRSETTKWICQNIFPFQQGDIPKIKMRPIGDSTPLHELKERWLDEYLNSIYPPLTKYFEDGEVLHRKDPIEFIFDSDEKCINMWRRRGIFVFNCSQKENIWMKDNEI